MYGAIPYEDVRENYIPKHLSRRDLRRWHRARRWAWLDEFDTQLAIGGIVAAILVTCLCVLGVVVSLVVK